MADDDPKPDPNPEPADDVAKMQAALHKANEEAKKYRLEAKAKDDELAQLKKAQDSSKSDMQKVQEQVAALEKRAETAEREALVATIAQAKKIPAALAGRLTGATREEIEADADGLLEALDIGGDSAASSGKRPPSRTPTSQLRPGSGSEEDAEPDIEKLLDKVPRL